MIIKNNLKINGLIPNIERPKVNNQNGQAQSFGNILSDKLKQNSEVKFSKHAELRLKE